MNIPKSHPRYYSLMTRHLIEEGYKKGITHLQGLIAQGRGEAFDYLLGEKTMSFAKKAIKAAAAQLLLAKNPVISVNGNVAVLCPEEIGKLCRTVNAKAEANLFYRSEERIGKIVNYLKKFGVDCLGRNAKKKIAGLESKRAIVEENGIYSADVVLVMLEDGDRTEMLKKAGKKVIAIDLSPQSRTAKKADITIVDNVVRALPLMVKEAKKLKKKNKKQLTKIVKEFDNKKNLKEAVSYLRKNI